MSGGSLAAGPGIRGDANLHTLSSTMHCNVLFNDLTMNCYLYSAIFYTVKSTVLGTVIASRRCHLQYCRQTKEYL